MLKKPITFEDPVSGDVVTEDYYFNLTKAECMELQLSEATGWAESMEKLLQSEDRNKLVMAIKDVILRAYGVRVGGDFLKSPAHAQAFSTSEAYSALFMELLTDDAAAAAFLNGIMPKDLVEAAAKNMPMRPSRLDAQVEAHHQSDVPVEKKHPKPGTMTRAEILDAMQRKNRGWPRELTRAEVDTYTEATLYAAMEAGCTLPE